MEGVNTKGILLFFATRISRGIFILVAGVKLRGTLLFCAVSDEEEGSSDGVQ